MAKRTRFSYFQQLITVLIPLISCFLLTILGTSFEKINNNKSLQPQQINFYPESAVTLPPKVVLYTKISLPVALETAYTAYQPATSTTPAQLVVAGNDPTGKCYLFTVNLSTDQVTQVWSGLTENTTNSSTVWCGLVQYSAYAVPPAPVMIAMFQNGDIDYIGLNSTTLAQNGTQYILIQGSGSIYPLFNASGGIYAVPISGTTYVYYQVCVHNSTGSACALNSTDYYQIDQLNTSTGQITTATIPYSLTSGTIYGGTNASNDMYDLSTNSIVTCDDSWTNPNNFNNVAAYCAAFSIPSLQLNTTNYSNGEIIGFVQGQQQATYTSASNGLSAISFIGNSQNAYILYTGSLPSASTGNELYLANFPNPQINDEIQGGFSGFAWATNVNANGSCYTVSTIGQLGNLKTPLPYNLPYDYLDSPLNTPNLAIYVQNSTYGINKLTTNNFTITGVFPTNVVYPGCNSDTSWPANEEIQSLPIDAGFDFATNPVQLSLLSPLTDVPSCGTNIDCIAEGVSTVPGYNNTTSPLVSEIELFTIQPAQNSSSAMMSAITAGTLSFTPPSALSWSATLTGLDLNLPTLGATTVDDATGSGAGWHLSAQMTAFTTSTTPTYTLDPNGQPLTISGSTLTSPPSATCATNATCTVSLPGTTVTYPAALPITTTVPNQTGPYAVFYSSQQKSGIGAVNLATYWNLFVPANTYAGTYKSTIDVEVASGP
jgi:hypothetical protein